MKTPDMHSEVLRGISALEDAEQYVDGGYADAVAGLGHVEEQLRINMRVEESTKKFLHYLFKDVSYSYDGLTSEEKALVSPERFTELVQWLRDDEALTQPQAPRLPSSPSL